MAGQFYDTTSVVYGKHLTRTLKKAQPYESLSKFGAQDEMPQNKSEVVEWQRWLPYGGVDNEWISAGGDQTFADAHLVAEGITPSADSIDRTKITATLQQIACLYTYTDKTRILHELGDEIPREMEDQVAKRLMICKEMRNYGKMKACTNQFFGGAGTSVATVAGPPTQAMFQNISRTIQRYHGGMPNKLLKSGPNFGTQAVNKGWPVFCHTDMEAEFQAMTGFISRENYGDPNNVIDDSEIGAVGRFRICVNPLLTFQPDAGAVVGSWTGSGTSPKSTSSTNIDVYPLIVVGQGAGHMEDAYGQVALRGFQSMMLTNIPTGTKSSADPFGQRGFVGGMTWCAESVLNDAWMAVAFVGTRAL